MSGRLTHIDGKGQARMVDVSGKPVTRRIAKARACVNTAPETLEMIVEDRAAKGDVLAAARMAGIMAAKRTSSLIPLCHPLPLSSVAVELTPADDPPRVEIEAEVATEGRTGVEMEAMTAVSVAALTVYDMVKSADRSARISDIRLTFKDGGKSGRYEGGT